MIVRRPSSRVLIFLLVLALLTALTAVFLVRAVHEQREKRRPTAATARDTALDLGAVLDGPHIVFRSMAPGPTYGLLAAVPLSDPAGKRSVSDMSCDRVFATDRAGVCLAAERGALTTYSAELLSSRLQPVRPIPFVGIPSRARISPDGSWVATTSFVSGHTYASANFATETRIAAVDGSKEFGNLELDFATFIDGRRETAADLNVWGVTFPPGAAPNTFYATVATGGRTWLARGDLAARTLTAIRANAECPSLSPDGRHLVYKKRAGSRTAWRYHVLELATEREWPLVEARSVDDQVAWLDEERVLYGVPRAGTGNADVWVARIGQDAPDPAVFMTDALSPAVVARAVAQPSGSTAGASPG